MLNRQTVREMARRTRAGSALGVANRFEEIVALYGGTDKRLHGYGPPYRRHLGPLRLRRNTVFEIGVGGNESPFPGGSLRVWRDYLPRSTVVGLDLYAKDVRLGARVHFRQTDQSVAEDLLRVVDEFGDPNVVIDDGSHVGDHIWTSFETLFPLLPRGALYVIEDLSTSYYPAYGGGVPSPHRTGAGLARVLVDDVLARDRVFAMWPHLGPGPQPLFADVAAAHVYPGITFVEKA